jgi:hypothetical protein
MSLSRGSQSDARAGRVTKSPQDTALRAYKGIWKIFWNALGIFSFDLHPLSFDRNSSRVSIARRAR